jgi:hypothetical protein
MKFKLLTIFSLTVASVGVFAQDAASPKHCKDHPKVIGSCFTFRGRLQQWNGAPTMRIFRFGTRRILGVSDGMSSPDYWQIPDNLSGAMTSFDSTIIADFEFCPFTADKPGVMRLGCVESAENIRLESNAE